MTIFTQAERLKLQESLPSKQAIMFLKGIKYQTGSDYSEEYLNTSVGELQDIYNQQICDEIEDQQFSWAELHGHINEDGELEV